MQISHSAIIPEDALVSEVIAEVARLRGIVLTQHDPLITAVFLNRVILQRYMAQMEQAFAEAVKRARNDLAEHAREQATYVEQTMLRDREQFVTEQKAALQALDTSLRKRDAGIVKIMADIVEKTRATFAEEMKKAVKEHTYQGAYNPNPRPKKAKNWAALGALALGIGVGVMGTMGTLIILLRLGVVGVVGAGQ